MIFLTELTLNPPIAPKIADITIRKLIAIKLETENISRRGAIFCHVKTIKPCIQLINSIT
jgi:hypothetical protein